MDFWKIIEDGWSIVAIYPKLFMAAIGGGLVVGWTAAWLVLSNRLTAYKEWLDQYEKVLSEKVPGQILSTRRRGATASLWVFGVIVIVATSVSGYYIADTFRTAPRHLTSEQRDILIRQAQAPNNAFGVTITIEQQCADCAQYGADLENALRGAGWAVRNGVIFGPPQRPRAGLGIIPGVPAESITTLERGLRAAGLDFDIMPPPSSPRPPSFNQTELLITAKTSH